MNIPNSKKYLIPAVVGFLLAIGLTCYFFFSSVSTLKETHYLYIDENDTQDSVIAKLKPIASPAGMTGLQTLFRHGDYADHIKTGRYAIRPWRGCRQNLPAFEEWSAREYETHHTRGAYNGSTCRHTG